MKKKLFSKKKFSLLANIRNGDYISIKINSKIVAAKKFFLGISKSARDSRALEKTASAIMQSWWVNKEETAAYCNQNYKSFEKKLFSKKKFSLLANMRNGDYISININSKILQQFFFLGISKSARDYQKWENAIWKSWQLYSFQS